MEDSVLGVLIGDRPVSDQLATALSYMAPKDHTHEIYATSEEVNQLKEKIELLIALVGDTSVSEQISTAINKYTYLPVVITQEEYNALVESGQLSGDMLRLVATEV